VHLPHAENIPRDELTVRAPVEIAPGEGVVVYGSDRDCREGVSAAAVLEELGYHNVFHFRGRDRGVAAPRPASGTVGAVTRGGAGSSAKRLRARARAGEHGPVRDALRICLQPEHLRRTLTIALVVGTILTAINHADAIARGDATTTTLTKAALNYLVPFLVSNLGLLAGVRGERG
jgi:hypothetical protein